MLWLELIGWAVTQLSKHPTIIFQGPLDENLVLSNVMARIDRLGRFSEHLVVGWILLKVSREIWRP